MRALLVLLILVGCAGKTVVTKPTESEMPKAYPAPAPPPPIAAAVPSYYPYIPREKDATAADDEPVMLEVRTRPRVRPQEPAPSVTVTCPTLAPSITYNCASPPCPGPPPPKPPGPWWEDQVKILLAAISGAVGIVITAVATRISASIKKTNAAET
jgi:hypothetical protein